VSDHAGRDWQYRYDGLGRLAEVINPDQTTRRYHYEHPDFPYTKWTTTILTEGGAV
jgi:YD repeat-containing protein